MLHPPRFTQDERDWTEAIAQAARRIAREMPRESAGFPQAAWAALAATGLFTMPFTPDRGGLGASLRAVMQAYEILGETLPDAGLVFSACTHLCALGLPLARFGSAEAQARFLPGVLDGSLIGAHAISEPHAGSAAFEMKTRAEPVAGGWRLMGEKCFVSNGPVAGAITVYARSSDAGPLAGFSAFVVPADSPGLTIAAPSPKIGLKSSEFCALYLDGVFVPEAHVLGRPGMGYAVLDHVMKREIVVTFAGHLGQMARRFGETRAHVRARTQAGVRIGSHQAVAHRVVEGFIALETARMWLARAGDALDRGEAAVREVAIAKLLTSEANLTLACDAIRLRGAAGYLSEAELAPDLTDAIGGVIYSGSSDIQRNRIAATLGL